MIKKESNIKLPITDYSNLYVVTDFDRTITTNSSKTSWAILSQTGLVPEEYVKERQALFDYYRPIEIDENMDFEERSTHIKE